MTHRTVARALGLFGIALGLAETAAPKRLGALIGLQHRSALLRLYGLREIASGLLLLAQPNPALGLWSRVAGDALDLATLGTSLAKGNPDNPRLAAAIAAVSTVVAIDTAAARSAAGTDANANANATEGEPSTPPSDEQTAKRVIAIDQSPDDLYRLWREPSTLPRIFGDAANIDVLDASRTQWKVDAPLGRTLEWETEIVEERSGELLRWRSLPGGAVPTHGSVHFRPAPTGSGSFVTLDLRFSSPTGPLAIAASLLPPALTESAIGTALRRFKSLAETGRVLTADSRPNPSPDGT